MARSRNIKPGFFLNEDLADNDPLARILFIGLWTLADFRGDLEWKPRKIKAQLLPYDNCDIEELAINLDKSRLIIFYNVEGERYVHIPNFSKHQNPHPNERRKGSSIPAFSKERSQPVDNKGVTINHDKSRQVSEDSITDRADSCFLIPDSLSLNPDSCSPLPDSRIPKNNRSIPAVIDRFSEFWTAYPKKVGKKTCLGIWKRRKLDNKADLIIADITRRQSDDVKWREGFIPNPQTYLNGDRWEDEIQTSGANPGDSMKAKYDRIMSREENQR